MENSQNLWLFDVRNEYFDAELYGQGETTGDWGLKNKCYG